MDSLDFCKEAHMGSGISGSNIWSDFWIWEISVLLQCMLCSVQSDIQYGYYS